MEPPGGGRRRRRELLYQRADSLPEHDSNQVAGYGHIVLSIKSSWIFSFHFLLSDRLKKRKSEPDAGPPLTSVIKTESDLGQQLEHDKKWREFTNFAIPLLSTLGPRQQDLALDSMKSLLANFAGMAALSSNSGDDENRRG